AGSRLSKLPVLRPACKDVGFEMPIPTFRLIRPSGLLPRSASGTHSGFGGPCVSRDRDVQFDSDDVEPALASFVHIIARPSELEKWPPCFGYVEDLCRFPTNFVFALPHNRDLTPLRRSHDSSDMMIILNPDSTRRLINRPLADGV